MRKPLASIFLISLSSFLLLELGFYLEGFLKYILFSIVAIIYFVLCFFFYGYMRDKSIKSKSKTMFIGLMIIPLISVFFNPTSYLHKPAEKHIVLRSTFFADKILLESTTSLTLLDDGTCLLKKYGYWYSSTEKGTYEIKGKKVKVEVGEEKMTFKLRNIHGEKNLCQVRNKKIDYDACFLIEKMQDTLFVKK